MRSLNMQDDHQINQSLIYEGPKTLDQLSCQKCAQPFLTASDANQSQEQSFKVKSAPSENWQETVSLWQCHEESYDLFIDPETKQLRIPDSTLLATQHVVELHPPLTFSSRNKFSNYSIQAGGVEHCQPLLSCSNCSTLIGYLKNQSQIKLSATSHASS